MRIAALDLGSNSFHLLVADAHPDGTFEPILRDKEVLRLADLVARKRRIGSEISAIVDVIRRFEVLAGSVGAEEIVASATSAFREAEDSAAVVDSIEAQTGVRVNVISGKDEARLIFTAIRGSVAFERSPALAADLGGGSLELMIGDQGGLSWSRSLKLGAARLTAELVSNDPPTSGERRALRQRMTGLLVPLLPEIQAYGPKSLIGSSGTFTALLRIAAAKRTGTVPASVNQLCITKKDLLAVHKQILSLSSAERERLAGVDARRADLLPAGSLLLALLMELTNLDELVGCDWALREGIVLDAIAHHHQAEWSGDPQALRRDSVLNLARRCNWHQAHSLQVARLACMLFDETRSLHQLRSHDREMLEYGALLHDIGEHISVEGHDKHTAYLIEHGRLRGFAPDEINTLICLGRFHRRGNPKTSFGPFEALAPSRRQRTLQLIALLRIADGLDRSHNQPVETLDVFAGRRRVKLKLSTNNDVDLELYGLRRKRELFERTFGVPVQIVVG